MPLLTIAAACARTVASSIVLPKWFQLFHPMGGVWASWAHAAIELPTSTKKTTHRLSIAFFLGSMFSFPIRPNVLTEHGVCNRYSVCSRRSRHDPNPKADGWLPTHHRYLPYLVPYG